ncbi:AAA family ATPase [[Kitasatospora] papulosa]|uniref:AAA family ATPase n=1 Tax=[Kitasatospora] papulosa TaxID=1464011 RepID=UPI002E139E04|nr:AAA family ATPase [[Kitasatospora] papulosa]
MSGVDTVRGIAYQQAQAVLEAIGLLEDPTLGSVRVEGTDDAVDIELLARGGTLSHAIQVKVRAPDYTWGESALLAVLKRWAVLPDAAHASFEFLTDGRLGPSGRRVQQALEAAAEGRTGPLAELLGAGVDDPVCIALGKARIRQDPHSTSALLARAEHQVTAMLPSARTEADLRKQATEAVDRLFRALFDFASNPEPQLREMDRQRIAALLGVPAEQSPAQRWSAVRERYLEAARSFIEQEVIAPAVAGIQMRDPSVLWQHASGGQRLRVGELLSVLAGRTGTGKTTAVRILRQQAAADGRVVITAHAESYLPGRLGALTADGLAAVLQEACPTATGAQALSDSNVTLVIDGAAEVAEPTRRALQEELLAPVSAGHGARIVLVGRDMAALRAMLPGSVSPEMFRMVPLEYKRRVELVEWATVTDGRSCTPHMARAVVATLDKTLGDAAGNPLVFSMAMALLDDQDVPKGRASLYRAFIEQLAARSGATGMSAVRTALGIVYALLLNDGRRYADVYEWHHLLSQAASALRSVGLPADVSTLDEAARRCGLITSLGWEQTVVPMHDSFADYLAGAAHASGAAPLPHGLSASDDQRMLFCAEIRGVDEAIAALVTRDLPFTAVALAGYDRRPLGLEAPHQVASVLCHLSAAQDQAVVMSRLKDGRALALRPTGTESAWVDEARAFELAQTCHAAVVDKEAGPLAVAARLWRQELLTLLRQPAALFPRRPDPGQTAAEALVRQTEQTALVVNQLIDLAAPPGHAAALKAQVGPLGLRAVIGRPQQDMLGMRTPVDYRHSDDIVIVEASAEPSFSPEKSQGQTALEHLLDSPPSATAAQRVREAIEALTTSSWLTP